MYRSVLVFVCASVLASCSKNETEIPVTPIPDIIQGQIREIDVDPIDINTPDKATMVISMNDALYKVQFNVTTEQLSNATLFLASDTILVDESREFGNFGQDIVSYNPVGANEMIFDFPAGGKKIEGIFNFNTSFGGEFGKDQIAQWREANVPNKPNQKAKDDIRNFIRKYMDSNGAEPGIRPLFLSVSVSRL